MEDNDIDEVFADMFQYFENADVVLSCGVIDDAYFDRFSDEQIKIFYEKMSSYEIDGMVSGNIACNLIYQMLKRYPSDMDVLVNGVLMTVYQESRSPIVNDDLLYMIRKNVLENKEAFQERLDSDPILFHVVRGYAFLNALIDPIEV